ncbi:cilia- and flagella-associated protein 418-like [Pelodytes ibericus]
MADHDLDQLLDEVETKFCGSAPAAAAAFRPEGGDTRRPTRSRSSFPKASAADEDLEDLIEDILSDHYNDENQQRIKPSSQQSYKTSNQAGSKKCCPVYIGGSIIPYGIGTNISERACNQLRCTACDFNIVIFDDYKWDPSCDYLFFRNRMPEVSKLQSGMIKKKGARAYACQCSWRSIQDLTDLRIDPELRWVCGKHSS